jgi:hypothetical protein
VSEINTAALVSLAFVYVLIGSAFLHKALLMRFRARVELTRARGLVRLGERLQALNAAEDTQRAQFWIEFGQTWARETGRAFPPLPTLLARKAERPS